MYCTTLQPCSSLVINYDVAVEGNPILTVKNLGPTVRPQVIEFIRKALDGRIAVLAQEPKRANLLRYYKAD